jgi:hypothetical protein
MISQTQAEKLLGPQLKRIRDCIVRAFQKWRSDYSKNALVHTARSRASVIHDHMVAFAKEYFSGDDSIRIFSKSGLAVVNIKDVVLLRFKKLDAKKRSSSIPTRQNYLFKAQLDLPGIPSELTHLEAGYVLNELQTGLDGVYITCPNKNRLEWFIDLTPLVGTNVTQITINSTPTAAPQAARRKRIKPKTDSKDKTDEGNKP